MDVLPFLITEEALKRHKSTIKLQEYLALMIWERARIEIAYVNGLHDWSDQIANDGKEFSEERLFQIVSDILPNEADMTASLHQRLYDMLVSETGPYSLLFKNIKTVPCDLGPDKEKEETEARELDTIEEEFSKYNLKKVNLEKENRKRQKSIDETQAAIAVHEDKMVNRSRIAVVRRSAKGHRKVDHVMKKLSDLRKRVELDSKEIKNIEMELTTLLENRKMDVQDLTKEIKTLERRRTHLLFSQLAEFIKMLQSLDFIKESDKRRITMCDVLHNIRTTEIDTIVDLDWKKTERKAKARKAGAVFSLQEFIQPQNQTVGNLLHGEPMSKSATTFKDPFNVAQLLRIQSMPPEGLSNVQDSGSVNILNTLMGPGGSENSIVEDHVVVSRPCSKFEASSVMSPCSSADSMIETIIIPMEEEARTKLPPPFPPKVFLPDFSEDETDDEYHCGAKLSTVSRFDSDMGSLNITESIEEVDNIEETNLGLMRDIRLIANHDYTARKHDELSFSRGQIVKQKVGENDEGYAYGWTRDKKLSSKQYGWYPVNMMSLYQSAS